MNADERKALPSLGELERTHRDWLWWFTGFFDGEGSLHASLPVDKLMPTVGLQMVQRSDDLQVLQQLTDTFRCGRIILGTDKRGQYRNRTTQAYRWQIRDCQVMEQLFIPLFDKFPLRSKKAKEYEYWRRLVFLKANDFRNSRAKVNEAVELIAKIREIRNG